MATMTNPAKPANCLCERRLVRISDEEDYEVVFVPCAACIAAKEESALRWFDIPPEDFIPW